MKRTINILIAALAGVFTLPSCSDWLDVTPNTDLPAKELFTTANGFQSALAGLYISMTEENIYGKNLSFGLTDQLVQMYDWMPDNMTDRNNVYIYDRETSGGYNTKGKLANIWRTQYNVIANANNLLKWWDLNGEVAILDSVTRNMIRGEALALRAFLHFDLLRGWGPMNYAGDVKAREMKCMPYRTSANQSKLPLLPANEVVARIISDLKTARECLSYEKELDLGSDLNKRCFRFNYHAINAMLARVYNYAGEKNSAALYAQMVIEGCGLTLQTSNDDDPILSKEVILGLNMFELVDNLSEYFAVGEKMNTKYYLNISTLDDIFAPSSLDSEDMRARSNAFYRSNENQMAISLKYVDNRSGIIPLIRLPEMYYIACEAAEAGDEAAIYVNSVRNKRGYSKANDVSCETNEKRIDALKEEFCKEFYGEGQYFWFLKSHGIVGELKHCPDVELTKERFVFPLPDAEVEYGWTSESEEL